MTKIKICTSLGDITIRLYDETPLHRDNFLKLAREGYYNGTLFHRVIKNFMIQGGDPESKGASSNAQLGTGGPGYTIPAEIKPQFFHKRGALAAARQGDEVNPERASSGSQFYIVWGQTYNDGQLNQINKQLQMMAEQQIFNKLVQSHREEIMQMRRNRDRDGLNNLQEALIAETKKITKEQAPAGLTEKQKEIYKTLGGTPHLDTQYTVFGEVIEGLDVVEAIQDTTTGRSDRPTTDISIKINIVEE